MGTNKHTQKMEVIQVLHMNKGSGDTSYAKNCIVQGKIISIAKPVMEEAILDMLCRNIPQSIGVADLGCSSGPNALQVISEIIDIVHAKCQNLRSPVPEVRVFLNDLPCNDFNSIFGLLPAFYSKLKEEKGPAFGPCFVSAMPGSFYGRLFPAKSLHCVHSSSSLHWLSQVPPNPGSNINAMNRGKIYISKTSPQCVLDSYSLQFQKDFSLFLRSRSEEIMPGGCMVLSFMGRSSPDPTTDDSCYQWELLANALMSMVREGLVEEEKVDSFDAPYYAPCAEELCLEIMKEGSFVIDRIESFEVEWDGGSNPFCTQTRGKKVAKTIRAVVESMLESHFGRHIVDDLFSRFADLVDDYLSNTATKYTNFVISLVRKNY